MRAHYAIDIEVPDDIATREAYSSGYVSASTTITPVERLGNWLDHQVHQRLGSIPGVTGVQICRADVVLVGDEVDLEAFRKGVERGKVK